MERYFEIRNDNYPDSVYKAVGQIIEWSQEWEQDFKTLAKMLNLHIKSKKNINKYSLDKLRRELNKYNLISKKDYECLKEPIDARTRINHEFFLTEFQKTYDCFEEKLSILENILNASRFVIFEATDLINNIIDKLKGSTIIRPTIFDNL